MATTLYTDGSSTKRRSGWGVVMICGDDTMAQKAGTEEGATNQRMELKAALEGLSLAMFDDPNYSNEDIIVYSDSAYLCNCYADKWYSNWENNGYINSKKEPIANKDLWLQLIPYFKNPRERNEKGKGHSGHVYNEMADKLATGALQPKDPTELTMDKINDKINIELSEILLDYSMKKYPVAETIKRIRKACMYERDC